MANEPVYVLQSAFTAGEISEEVASRTDLDKYQYALTKAQNCMIKPHGPVYKRPGLKHCSETKYPDRRCILTPFNSSDGEDYLLEIGHEYIRVHKDGVYLGVELLTPYTEDMLYKLRFTQSADTMFIASGDFPLK